jgi:hypothetical protein
MAIFQLAGVMSELRHDGRTPRISQMLFVIAGLSFFVGGRVVSEFTKTDRVSAERLGVGSAFAFGIFGMVAKNTSDNPDDEDSSGQWSAMAILRQLRPNSHGSAYFGRRL